MKIGRYFKPGDTIPVGTTFIEYKNDMPKRAVIAKTEADSVVLEHYNGAMYELLDFAWPEKPPQPELGEVWEIERRDSKERLLARYDGEKSKLNMLFSCNRFDLFPCDVRFIRRWSPEK